MAADDVYHTIETDRYKARFLLGGDDDVDTVDNVDAYVDLPDGTTWSATVLTLDAITRIMRRWSLTGEALGGIFFQCPDLVIVREPGVPAMMEVIDGLVDDKDERLQDVFQYLELSDDDD